MFLIVATMIVVAVGVVYLRLNTNVSINTFIRNLEATDEVGNTRKAQWVRELFPGRFFQEGISLHAFVAIALAVLVPVAWLIMPWLPGSLRIILITTILTLAGFFLPRLLSSKGIRRPKALAAVIAVLLLVMVAPRALPGVQKVDGGFRVEAPDVSPGSPDVPVDPSGTPPSPLGGPVTPSPTPIPGQDPFSPPVSPPAPSQSAPQATAPPVPPVIRGRVKDIRAQYPPQLYRQERIPGGGVRIFFAPDVWIDIRGEKVVACNPDCVLARS